MTNFYPEKPIVPYKSTPVEMTVIIQYLQKCTVDPEIKRATYVIARNESSNGKSIINFNLAGLQADSGRWSAVHDAQIVGVVIKNENQTGKQRLFLAFNDVTGCLDMLIERVEGRGLYIGGVTHKILIMHITTPVELARAYTKEWVQGSATAEPTKQAADNFLSMSNQAAKLFQ